MLCVYQTFTTPLLEKAAMIDNFVYLVLHVNKPDVLDIDPKLYWCTSLLALIISHTTKVGFNNNSGCIV